MLLPGVELIASATALIPVQAGLSWSVVDWIKGTISVRRQIHEMPRLGATIGGPKTHSAIPTIRLGETSPEMRREQQRRVDQLQYEAGDDWQERALIFPSRIGTPFAPCAVQDEFHRVLEASNLPRIRFHDLRHTAPSLMLSHGVAALVVSKILGHSSPSITLAIYAHSALDMQDHAAGVVEEIVAPVAVTRAQLQPTATASDFVRFWDPQIWQKAAKYRLIGGIC